MKNIIVQNISPYKQKAWVFVATDEADLPEKGKIGKFAFYKAPKGIYVNCQLDGGETQDCPYFPGEAVPAISDFKFSTWVADDLNAVLPTFMCDGQHSEPMNLWDGTNQYPYYFKNVSADAIKQVWYFKTQIRAKHLTIEGWFTFYRDQDVVEFAVHSTYGTVTSPSFGESMGILYMLTGEVCVVDYALRKGLLPTGPLNGKWATPIAAALQRGRAQRVEATGAVLCLPKLSDMALEFSKPENFPRIETLYARQLAPICGVSKSWKEDKKWLVFGETPLDFPEQLTHAMNSRNVFLNKIKTNGNEYDQRPYATFKWSGTSGDHEDFGASKGQIPVTCLDPWSIWDVRYSCQQWALRPTANRETNGDRVLFVNHPVARSYEQGIDPRFSAGDMLGWPNPTPWDRPGSGATPLDEQHRSDNYLFATYALTRDPALESIIKDCIEIDRMDIRVVNGMSTASRAIGRLLMSKANMVHLGFPEATASMMATFNAAYSLANYKAQSANNVIKVINVDNPAKYGWVDASGAQITGWVPWQESIAIMGFYAVHRITKDARCLELIKEVGKTIINHAFFHNGANWDCLYALRWNGGQALPASSYNYNPINYDLVVGGITRWTLPAVKIFAKLFPEEPEAKRASDILAALAVTRNFADATWWAV